MMKQQGSSYHNYNTIKEPGAIKREERYMNKVLKRSRTFILLVAMVVTSFSGTGSFAIHTRAASQLGKVTSLTLTVNSRPAASLSWDQVAGGADSYKIYRNNKATVIIKGIGAYKGTCKKSFRILPKGTKLTRAKTNKKAIALAWKKNVKQTTGYQIQYGLKKSLKGAKIKTLKNKAGRLTLKGLKSRKKYYIRIRTYKTIGKKKYCSRWSKEKKVKVR